VWEFLLRLVYRLGRIARFLHLLRVQLIAALAMLAFAALTPTQPILQGLCDGIGFRSTLLLSMQAFLLAWTLHLSTRLVLIYGPARYGIGGLATAWRWVRSPWSTLIAFSLLAAGVLADIWLQTGNVHAPAKTAAFVIGFLLAALLLIATANLHGYIEGSNGLPGEQRTTEQMYPEQLLVRGARGGLEQRHCHTLNLPQVPARYAVPDLADGFLENGYPRSGHRMAALFVSILLLLYGIFAWQGIAEAYNSERMPAALFYVFLLSILTVWIFSGLTFLLDRFHIPTITALLALSVLASLPHPTDHLFRVTHLQGGVQPLSPQQVVAAWDSSHPNHETDPLVIVAAEGGGIEAAAWGTFVLRELDKASGGALHDHVVLISSVSGGSAAAYYFLDQYEKETPDFKKAYVNASASSLSATAWGLAYPDVLRTAPLVGLTIGERADRGRTMEDSWRKRGTHASLRDWRNKTAKGTMPAVLFNATGVESGQPVIFGTTRLSEALPLFSGENDRRLDQQFFLAFPCSDVDASTAARMSAAFPYVSPEARPDKTALDTCGGKRRLDDMEQQRLHVADGGLFDNSGAVSALHWIYDLTHPKTADRAKVPASQHPLILLLLTSPYSPKGGHSWAWQHQSVGPLEAMMDIRTGSQHLRRNLEGQLLSDLQNNGPAGATPLTVLRFCNVTDDKLQTLSWHLTTRQENAVRRTWYKTYAEHGNTYQETQALLGALSNAATVQPVNSCPKLLVGD